MLQYKETKMYNTITHLKSYPFGGQQLIRALRLVFAAIIGLIIAHLSHLPHSVWIVISIVVVLFDQSTVGGTIQKGGLRIIATIISACISIMALYLFKNNLLINEIIFILCLFMLILLWEQKKVISEF